MAPDTGAGGVVTRVTGHDPGDQAWCEWKGCSADSIDAWAEEAEELRLQGSCNL